MAQRTSTSNKPAPSKVITAAKPTARSRLTNGSALLAGVDGRTRDARRWRDLYVEFLAQTNGEHANLCRQLASLSLQRERLDAKLASGDDVDPLHLVRVSGAITRVMERIGLLAESDDEPEDATDAALAALRAAS